MPMAPVYATAKAGVVQFTRSVAPVLIKQGIRCCALCPQQVDTPLVCTYLRHALYILASMTDASFNLTVS